MLVSICIPTYNSPVTLKKCLDSVVSQNFKDFELIISDDSTTNEVKFLIDEYNFTSILIYVKNLKPLGSPDNWNKALSFAKGKYIKIMHHDDYFTDSNSLSLFVNALESDPSANLAVSYSKIYFKKNKSYFIHKQNRSQIKRINREPEFLFFRNVIGAPSATLFRNFEDLNFNTNFKWLVDVEFYLNYLKKHPGIVFIPEALLTIVDGAEGQITQTVSDDKNLIIRENLNLFSVIYSKTLNTNKALLFFEELFLKFNICDFKELIAEFAVPNNLIDFMKTVFEQIPKHKLLKKIKKRILTSRYNKSIFKIERF
jgi:glycosyltransferase involved in cell wall biosynthesis